MGSATYTEELSPKNKRSHLNTRKCYKHVIASENKNNLTNQEALKAGTLDTKMDKILLTAFLSALAEFITAVISVVKLVNEKESKTTDYRQSWTDSARKSLSELISNLNTQASLRVNIRDSVDNIKKTRELLANQNNDEIFATRISNLVDEEYKEEQSAIREMQREIYKSYAFTRLHFKPNDATFIISCWREEQIRVLPVPVSYLT